MKRLNTSWPLMAIAFFTLTFASCKKATVSNANDSTNVKDANGVSNSIDATSDDATAVAGQVAGMAGKTTTTGWYMLCGATAVDTGNGRQVVITYDGTTVCNGLTRSGTVTVTLASGSAAWAQAGAQLNVAITNVKVTDVTTGNNFTVNGTHTITNEIGGLAWEMFWNPIAGAIVRHRDKSSNMTITFSDGTRGSWSVDRTRIWSVTASGVNFEVTTENTNGEDTWGNNRYSESFNTTIPTAIEADNNSSCPWRPYQGKYVYSVPSRNATASVLFGTNGSGASVGSATTCAPGYYLTYKLSNYNYTYNLYLPYW